MSDLKQMANGRDPVVTNGKLKTTFRRVTGVKKLDRQIAKNNMKDAGITQICKGNKAGRNNGKSEQIRKSDSKFATYWKEYVY